MTALSPSEWAQQQAALAPEWSEEKWQRVARILGVEFVPTGGKTKAA